jgi:uncharacterized protein YbaR (Trm112 family)
MTTTDPPADSVDPKMLEMLVCPRTQEVLKFDAVRKELISAKEKLAFPIRDGIPIMRIDEARKIDDNEARKLP